MIKKQHVKSRNTCKVTFELPADLQADAVYLIADYNGWQDIPFERLKSGKWKLVQELEPGNAYQIRYKISEAGNVYYLNDSDADGTTSNDQGSENAVIRC